MSVFKPHLDELSLYEPPLEGRDPSHNLLLDFNERTIPVNPAIQDALISAIEENRLHQYPTYAGALEKLAQYSKVPVNQLMFTNGLDQAIDLVARSCLDASSEVIIPMPSFVIYEQFANLANAKIIKPQYQMDSGFPVDQVIQSITEKTDLIMFANPNNPTGTEISLESIVRIAKAAPQTAIFVDECYFEYSGLTACHLIDEHPNIIIGRTFSKTWGMAGLRLGYLIASPEAINTFLKIRGPYDINQLAVVAAVAALEHPQYMQSYIKEVMQTAKPYFEQFLQQQGIEYWPSRGNFVWIFLEDAKTMVDALEKAKILVRPKADSQGRLGLRITMGTLEQVKQLIKAMKANL